MGQEHVKTHDNHAILQGSPVYNQSINNVIIRATFTTNSISGFYYSRFFTVGETSAFQIQLLQIHEVIVVGPDNIGYK